MRVDNAVCGVCNGVFCYSMVVAGVPNICMTNHMNIPFKSY